MTAHDSILYRSDVQGLRAIAIILVVLNHAEVSLFSGGFIGVDIFFVLSGYLITSLLVREFKPDLGMHRQFWVFISRRLKRLLPALVIMLILVMLLAPFLMTGYEFREQTRSVAYASTWTSNFFFALSTIDYFSDFQTRDLFLHTWSLGVEEQFYIVWPILLFVILSSVNRISSPDKSHQLAITLSVLFSSSLGLSLYWSEPHPLWSFYFMPTRIWQFAMGAGIYVWYRNYYGLIKDMPWLKVIAARSNWLGIGGLLLIVGSSVLMHRNMTYPGYWALLPSLGAVLIITAGIETPASFFSNRFLSHPVLVWIGDRSYSWYLWHWPVFVFGISWAGKLSPAESIILAALSLALATLSYRWVELPFWKGQLSQVSPARIIAISAAVMASVAVSTPNTLQLIQFDTEEKGMLEAQAAREDLPIINSMGCDTWYTSAEVKPCIFTGPAANKTVLLFADSVGAQWYSLLPEIYKAPDWRIVVLTKSSCPIIDEDYFYSRIGKTYRVCTQWRNAAMKYIESIRPDIIFIGSSTSYDFNEEQWVNGASRILKKLTSGSDRVLIIPGTPTLSFNGPSCLMKHAFFAKNKYYSTNGPICREKLADQAGRVTGYLGRAAKKFQKVNILNLNNLVCPDGYCSAKSPADIVVFRDQQHLTDSFVRSLAPNVRKKIEKLGASPL